MNVDSNTKYNWNPLDNFIIQKYDNVVCEISALCIDFKHFTQRRRNKFGFVADIFKDNIACRAVATQRQQDGRMYQDRFWAPNR
jgi:hypothetical protein